MNTRNFPERKSIRLRDYDYSTEGSYFITICTQDRLELFGKIDHGKMIFNNVGELVKNIWESLSNRYGVELDVFQIMPNHIHGIIHIVGAGFMPARDAGFMPARPNKRATTRVAPTLGDIIGSFKSMVIHQYINNVENKKWPMFDKRLWQRNYYEHIIHHEDDLCKIRQYIIDNPKMWDRDRNNPKKRSYQFLH